MSKTHRKRIFTGALVGISSMSLLLTACASSDDGGSNESGGSGADVTVATLADSGCGALPGELPTDAAGILSAFPEDVQAGYIGSAGPVLAPGELDLPEAPWKIGYASFPDYNAINHAYITQFTKRFEEAKADGLVEGSLDNQAMDPNSMSPATQIQNFNTLVSNGNDAILMAAMAPAAYTQMVDEAGADGVLTFSFTPFPDATYGFGAGASFYTDAGVPAAAVLNSIGGKGHVVVVHGLQGVDPETYGALGIEAALGECSDITVDHVNADFTDAGAKTAMQKYLASHPGQIDAVLHVGAMSTGIIQSFVDAGRDVPPVTMNGANSGALAWWAENKDTYSTAGSAAAPEQQADMVWDAMIRTMQGESPVITTMTVPTTLVNNDNLSEILVDGAKPLESTDPMGSGIPYFTDEQMDVFFSNAG